MKHLKVILPVLALLICTAATLKKGEDKKVYAYGLSISFNDSVVYYTDIQMLDSVKLDKKNMLPNRTIYTYQMKNYLENQKGLKNRTCMIYYSENKAKLSKDLNKTVARYRKDGKVTLQRLETGEFQFKKPEGY